MTRKKPIITPKPVSDPPTKPIEDSIEQPPDYHRPTREFCRERIRYFSGLAEKANPPWALFYQSQIDYYRKKLESAESQSML